MPHLNTARLAGSASLIALATALAALPSRAQEAEGTTFLGTICVTGENVVRDLMQTASSVSVITGEELTREKPGKDEIRSALAGTPNLIYTDSVSTPMIRGQNSEGPHTGASAFFAGSVPRATINLDGHYLSYNELYFGATSAWDLDGVEVFRGPQTTSQGANAIGGAIIVNTKDPTWEPEGAWRLEYGNHAQRRASFAWSGPLNDQFAARIALDYSARDTFIDYVNPGFIQNEIGQDFSNFNARLKLLWVPADIDGPEVKLTYSHSDMTRPSAEGAAPDPTHGDLRSTAIWMPGWDQTTDTAIMDTTRDQGNGVVFSNKLQVSDSEVARRVGTPTAGDADVSQTNYSNDSRLTFGTPEDTLSGVAGVYTAYTRQSETLNQGGISTFSDRKHNPGVYGELNWRIDEQWTLTGGLRYQRDHIRRRGDVSPLFASSDVDFDATFEEVLPRLVLSYGATPDWVVGAMVSKGYNPGGISLDFGGTRAWSEFDAETVWNYELFTRANLMEDRLFLTGNLFYMDYKNAQHSVTQLIGAVYHTQTFNGEKAHAWGLELAMDYRPTDALTLRAGAGFLQTEFDEMTAYPAYVGNEFARSPGTTLSLGASWDVNEKLTLGGQIRFTDGYYSNTANTPAYEVDDYTLLDINASYRLSDSLELYGYVNNLLDSARPPCWSPRAARCPSPRAA